MSIKIIQGSLMDATENIIAHQVNCKGVMGSGIAKQIRSAYPNVYAMYQKKCQSAMNIKDTKGLLGHCQILSRGILSNNTSGERYVANLFGQHEFGYGKNYTDYRALETAFTQLKAFAEEHGFSIAMPYYIGCGRAGGDWNVVAPMINKVFQDLPVTLYQFEPTKEV